MTDISPDTRDSSLLKPAEIKITPPLNQSKESRQPPSVSRLSSYSGLDSSNSTGQGQGQQGQQGQPQASMINSNDPLINLSSSSTAYSSSNGGSPRSRRNTAMLHNSASSTSPSRLRSNSAVGNELTPTPSHHQPAHTVTRQRRSSSLIQHLEPDTLDTKIDQALNPNVNANWVDQKGAWIIHIVIIVLLKIFYNFISVLDNDWKWTLTNLTYTIGSYIMFHQVKGTPFEFNSGAYDNLTMWEQIDNGDQYTPSKKFLMLVPIGLFLISTHYSRYNLYLFLLNGLSCLCVVVPKLAFAHRLRVTLF
ncbi:ORM1 [Candida oxycetoniae]|uniref:ORM1 n=1 Tax=Candida oxycetoniae TaxID=497107 RepID=A0AAI9SUE9_9ASCO|nr:ORM1 [Candida oxycetoniae]KAI3403090.2 ORM1 [Candida oxycetoniae]